MASQITKILSILKKNYPHAKIVLNYGNNWELLVSVILSAQCTDKKVNEVTEKLFEKYRKLKVKDQPQKKSSFVSWSPSTQPKGDSSGFGRASDFSLREKSGSSESNEILNFSIVPTEELEKDIKSTGFYHNKAKNIQGAARKILENFGGKIPRKMEELLTIPGVARKTANIVLGNAYGIISGIAVDTHVQRVSQRLRLVDLGKIGGGKKALFFIKNGQTPAVRSPLPWSPSTRRGVATAGFGRSGDFSFREKSGSSEKRGVKNLDYYKNASPEKIEQQLMKIVPKSDWFKLTYWVIEHGRAMCKAQKPRCEVCPLRSHCPASRI